MTYLLDTSICVFLMRRTAGPLARRIASRAASEYALSQVTVAELEFGVQKSQSPEANQELLENFLIPFTVLDFDRAASFAYGPIRLALESTGRPIGALDMLIAAHAMSRNLTLLTHNLREFKRVPGLRAEDWTKP